MVKKLKNKNEKLAPGFLSLTQCNVPVSLANRLLKSYSAPIRPSQHIVCSASVHLTQAHSSSYTNTGHGQTLVQTHFTHRVPLS